MGAPVTLASDLKTWILIFNPRSKSLLARWLSFGRFKHVSAMAYVTGLESWVLFDVAFSQTRIAVLPNRYLDGMTEWVEGCTLVRIERGPERERWWPPLFGWCAPSVAHLVGLRVALQPSSLYRQCLRNGGVVLNAENPAAPGRS